MDLFKGSKDVGQKGSSSLEELFLPAKLGKEGGLCFPMEKEVQERPFYAGDGAPQWSLACPSVGTLQVKGSVDMAPLTRLCLLNLSKIHLCHISSEELPQNISVRIDLSLDYQISI